ncbi:MAG TPA: hypothetical protein VK507_02445 [Iamia sp.]|nr:hypothetical protein [Iamia sp.]
MVAVVAAPGGTEAVRPLVRALARHVDARAVDRAPDAVAYLVAGAAALDQVPAGAPVAVAEEDRLAIRRGDAAQVVDLVTGPTVDTASWPPLPPHVRRRWRQRLGLDPDLVVDTAALDPDDVPTALAVAAAAVVAEPDLPLALALGCPSVVSAGAAAAVGAVDEVHVVVGGRPEAEALAADDRRAALLSRQAGRLAREALDPSRSAAVLLRAWGIAPAGPNARVDERLAELGTAPAGPVRRRVADALAPFTAESPDPGGR